MIHYWNHWDPLSVSVWHPLASETLRLLDLTKANKSSFQPKTDVFVENPSSTRVWKARAASHHIPSLLRSCLCGTTVKTHGASSQTATNVLMRGAVGGLVPEYPNWLTCLWKSFFQTIFMFKIMIDFFGHPKKNNRTVIHQDSPIYLRTGFHCPI